MLVIGSQSDAFTSEGQTEGNEDASESRIT